VKRRIIAAIAAAVVTLGVTAPAAYADRSFGPGGGGGTGNEKCHPPGQTTDVPGCK
jgi:hypothetical protein